MDFDNAKPPRGGRDSVKLEDLVEMLNLKTGKGKHIQMRIMPGNVLPVRRHWVDIIGKKSRNEVTIPKFCVAHDTKTDGPLEDVTCAYCEIQDKNPEHFYLVNVIVRALQENEPARPNKPSKAERKSGFKSPGSEAWSPVKVLRVPASVMGKIQGLRELNKVKDKKTKKAVQYSVVHAKYGCDILLKYNEKGSGTDKYDVQKGDRSPLTEEELAYLQFKLSDDLLVKAGRETEKEAKAEIGRMELATSEEGAEDDDDDDSDVDVSKGKGKKSKKDDKKSKSKKDDKKGKKKKPADDDDDEDEDLDDEDSDDDDDDEDEDDRSSKKSKSKKDKGKKSKKSSKDDDDDDEDEDEDEDEDDDSDDDEDDEDSDDDDDDSDDEDDEEEEDDEDSEDDDEDDEDDDEPVSKKSSKSKKGGKDKGKKSKKSSKDDDDDDEDDEDEEDEDEDDEDEDDRSSKKSKKSSKSKKPAKAEKKSSKKDKGKKSKKNKDDDDLDDDDIPF